MTTFLDTQTPPQALDSEAPDDSPCLSSYQNREATYKAPIGLQIWGWLYPQLQNEERNGVFK